MIKSDRFCVVFTNPILSKYPINVPFEVVCGAPIKEIIVNGLIQSIENIDENGEFFLEFESAIPDLMTLNHYQDLAKQTLPDNHPIYALLCGLCSETGEVLQLWQKHAEGKLELQPERIKEELGDVLWYLTSLATVHGFTLSEVASYQIDKLQRRMRGEK